MHCFSTSSVTVVLSGLITPFVTAISRVFKAVLASPSANPAIISIIGSVISTFR